MIDIATRRLQTQRLIGEPFRAAVDVVDRLGAVQSQDYAGAKWALGQRAGDVTDAELDRLFDAGAILRTHVLRPTWHFVLPDDIRWLLDLTAPRVKAILARYDARLDVDPTVLRRGYAAIETALRDGFPQTRSDLALALKRAAIPASGQRLAHILMHAELDGLIASGPRRGKQFTYALLEERAKGARRFDRDEALTELARRYFTGHGPAQIKDLCWWSGLTAADVKRGLELVGPALAHEVIEGKSYWSSPEALPSGAPEVSACLLPNYDEFLVAYRDRAASFDPVPGRDRPVLPNGSILAHVVVVNGQVRCGWKRRLHGRQVVVELGPLDPLGEAETAALRQSTERLARFLGTTVTVARTDQR